MLYLVTGGAGFIGAHLVGALVARGQQVRVLDNFSTGRATNLAHVLGRDIEVPPDGDRALVNGVEVVNGDIRDPAACREACAGVAAVLHQAAMRAVPRSVDDPMGATEANVIGTLNMLMAAAEARVQRFVNASSSSIYGDNPALPKSEDQVPAPISPYAASKLAGEHYCRVFTRTYGVPTVSMRYFNVFGPLQDPASRYAAVIPLFVSAILDGRPLEVHGDGLQSRDFTYIDNVVAANLLAADARDLSGDALNIACGERVTILEVAEAIERLLGRTVERNHTPPRRGDVRHTLADISKAREQLGYAPTIGFADGIERTVSYFARQHAGGRTGASR